MQFVYIDIETGTIVNGPVYKVDMRHISDDVTDFEAIEIAKEFGERV